MEFGLHDRPLSIGLKIDTTVMKCMYPNKGKESESRAQGPVHVGKWPWQIGRSQARR